MSGAVVAALALVAGAVIAAGGVLVAATHRRRALAREREVAELARRCDALQRRVLVADELAGQERARAEQAAAGMFELLSGLVAAEEAARGQLAAELHDTVAQSLLLARSLLADPDAPAGRAQDLVEEAEEQLRAVMARTRPPALRDGDLAAGVAALRRDLGHRYGLEVVLSWPAAAHPVPLAIAVTVYRFFQEALVNVVKHSDAATAAVGLAVEEDVLVATVRDEGPGFEPAAVRPSAEGRQVGLGLLRERVRLAGGSLAVDSRPGGPTVLTVRIPLTAPLPAASDAAAPAA